MRYQDLQKPAYFLLLTSLLLSHPVAAVGQQDASEELAEIREMVVAMKADYEARITALEERLAAAEMASAARPSSSPAVRSGSVTAGTQFNPQISVVLDGNYYHDGLGGDGARLIGEVAQPSRLAHAGEDHEHGGGQTNGANLRTAEFAFSGAVDPYFDAAAFLAVEGDEIHLEEAWLASRALPYGLRLKAGKFLSDIGYWNNKHEHQWDFADQNLAYLNLLGDHGLQDTGSS
jgi:hypothetical protein